MKAVIAVYVGAWIVFVTIVWLMVSDTISHRQPDITKQWDAYQRNLTSTVGSAPLHAVDRPRP
jgi:hypothetical protein